MQVILWKSGFAPRINQENRDFTPESRFSGNRDLTQNQSGKSRFCTRIAICTGINPENAILHQNPHFLISGLANLTDVVVTYDNTSKRVTVKCVKSPVLEL